MGSAPGTFGQVASAFVSERFLVPVMGRLDSWMYPGPNVRPLWEIIVWTFFSGYIWVIIPKNPQGRLVEGIHTQLPSTPNKQNHGHISASFVAEIFAFLRLVVLGDWLWFVFLWGGGWGEFHLGSGFWSPVLTSPRLGGGKVAQNQYGVWRFFVFPVRVCGFCKVSGRR